MKCRKRKTKLGTVLEEFIQELKDSKVIHGEQGVEPATEAYIWPRQEIAFDKAEKQIEALFKTQTN